MVVRHLCLSLQVPRCAEHPRCPMLRTQKRLTSRPNLNKFQHWRSNSSIWPNKSKQLLTKRRRKTCRCSSWPTKTALGSLTLEKWRPSCPTQGFLLTCSIGRLSITTTMISFRRQSFSKLAPQSLSPSGKSKKLTSLGSMRISRSSVASTVTALGTSMVLRCPLWSMP